MQQPPKKKYKHLSQFERDRIQSLLDHDEDEAEIARIIDRDKSTVGREIKRNRRTRGDIAAPNQRQYQATSADHKAYVRRKYAKYQGKKINEHKELKAYIIRGLKKHWNPDEISGAMRQEKQPFYASKTAVYEWLYSEHGQRYCRYLPSKRHRPKPRRPKPKQAVIRNRVSITKWPLGATNRSRFGHSEGDTMVSGKKTGSTAALAVTVERKARYVDARQIPNLKPASFNRAVTSMLSERVKNLSLSLDNGIENRRHSELGLAAFFCDPYSSWQKGSVEQVIGMLRRYFPKGMDLAVVSQRQLNRAVSTINNKPRKTLGYKSALQVMTEQGLLRQTEFTKQKRQVALRG